LWEVHTFPVRDGGVVALLSDVSLVRRASEFRRRFVQDLSHELRSPLAVLRTTVEALEDEVPAQLSEVVVRQVERIDRLTNELYELASLEAGQVQLEMARVAVAEVAREVAADFRPEAERAAVEFEIRVGEGVAAWCDRRGLYRVLSNLVDNAIKYNRREGWVRLTADTLQDGGARIQVADSGAGIPAGELQAVLQRFYRVERARTPGRGGLGLGLAIVKHMVQHMGGTLEIDSREGLGTTVRLRFPPPPGARQKGD
jgi:two-component system phosphate regulon sensor histidine kinase PhoR